MTAKSLRPDMVLRPLPPLLFLPVALVVLVAGGAYCLGYEGLSGGIGQWPASLLWSAYGVLPWLFLFEGVKRRERSLGKPLPPAEIALLLLATGAASIGAELAVDWLRDKDGAPFALQLMRRLPAIGATFLLLLLARRATLRAGQARICESESEALLRHVPALRWIRAADNYLELHLDGRIVTLRLTMREAAELLERRGFVRIHRSYLIARSAIENERRDSVRLKDGTELPLGKAFAASLSPGA